MASRDQQKRQTRQAFFLAVLDLCAHGQSFSSISLRQLTREVGVVPTAFYRHFADMDELGACLVTEALGTALAELRTLLQVGKKRTFDRQIATSIELFFKAIDKHPSYWHFIVTERYGGNLVVHEALNEQIGIFTQLLAHDLGLQPAFSHLRAGERGLLADMGINLFFSWVYDWLKLTTVIAHPSMLQPSRLQPSKPQPSPINLNIDSPADSALPLNERAKSAYLENCTRQAQLLFYGVSNWRASQD